MRLGGNTTIHDCAFVSNLAARSGPAVGAVGVIAVRDSSFEGNTFFCPEKKFLEEVRMVSKTSSFSLHSGICELRRPLLEYVFGGSDESVNMR